MTIKEALNKVLEFPEVKSLKQAEELRILQWSIIEELLDINKANGQLVKKLEHRYLKLSGQVLERSFGVREADDRIN